MVQSEVKFGKHRVRRNYGRIKDVLDMPNLTEVQTASFKWFLDKGLKEAFNDVLPIEELDGKLLLEYEGYETKEPKYTIEEARKQSQNYEVPLHLTLRLTNRETGEIKTSPVYFGELPLMTDYGTFIINGAERVVVFSTCSFPRCLF